MAMNPIPCEELEDRLAAIHHASLELVQEISLNSLLEQIAATACEQTKAQYGAVGLVNDNNKLELFIPIGMDEEEIIRINHPPRGKGLLGEVISSHQVISIPDLSSDPRGFGFPKNHAQMTSFLGVPICRGEHVLGVIYLTNKIDAPEFTHEDQEVIETLAGYAAVAISNARLYQELTERDRALIQRNENLALLNDLAPILATSTDVDQILQKTLGRVMDYLYVDVGDIFLRQDESKTLILVIHEGDWENPLLTQTQYQIGDGFVGMTAKNGQSQLIDLSKQNLDGKENCLRQAVFFPLQGQRGGSGVLCMATCNPHPLDELQVQFLSAISSWLGTAIENMRLNIQQRRLAVLEERERIGMDLHDGIIQSIYAVGLTLEHARLILNEDIPQANKRIEQAINDLNNTIHDLRAYILDLRPRQLHDENLIDGIYRLVSEFRANTLVEVHLQGSQNDFMKLPKPQALALFLICQEALANIAKHARAGHVVVLLWTTADRALLEVSDDGVGFEIKKVKFTLGHGLANMKTRAHNAGGDMEITTEPGKGSTILTWVPLSNEG